MLRNYAWHDNIEDVADLRSTDDVLVVGEISIPGLKRYVASVSTVRRPAELRRAEGRLYTKVVVGGLAPEMMADFRALMHRVVDSVYDAGEKNDSSMIIFSFDKEEERNQVRAFLDNEYPWANHWTLRSRLGELVVSDAKSKDRFIVEEAAA